MSRIHEALKKAEIERGEAVSPAAAGAAEPEPDVVSPALAPPGGAPSESARGGIAAAAFEPITLDTIRKQCPTSQWSPDSHAVLFADLPGHSHPAGAEEFRSLRSRLYAIRERQPLQTVLVTSALPSEGKTFVTLNLARAIAQQPQRSVLVIDADLRISRVHEGVGASVAPGLTDYLRGDVDALSVLQRGRDDNFFIIPGGSHDPNPVELLGTGRLRALINRFAPVFDWIILDSPPCVFLADASLLGKVSDGVLMVVQSGVTPFDTAQKACREFQEKQVVGVVLNRVPAGLTYGYYYYGYGTAQQPAKN
jgi:protein-tyrosine kinase